MDRAVLDTAIDRAPVSDDGRSGATLERVLLADGTRVVIKRFDPSVDLVMQLSGDTRGREVDHFQRGLLDRLPASVLHPVIDGWYEDDGNGVLVMRDLGDAVLGWTSIVTREQATTMFRAVADLHAAFLGSAPEDLTPLGSVLSMFEPRRIRPYAGAALVDYALRGWEYWPDVAPGDVGERVLALGLDTAPLTAACVALPTTLLHGDLSTVNMAFEPDRPGCLTLIDWGLATVGPAEVDIGRLLAGCGHLFGRADVAADLDDLVALQRRAAGPAHDETALRLGLLAGLVWLGWNKALDIVEHPDPAVRERERAALPWWLHRAEQAFETGII
jgi:Phosphotransferase enzyme family